MAKLIDGYLMDDMIVYRGLQKGGYVGRGYRVHPPDCENAEVRWLNRLEDDLRVLLSSLKEMSRQGIVATPAYLKPKHVDGEFCKSYSSASSSVNHLPLSLTIILYLLFSQLQMPTKSMLCSLP